MFDIESSKNVHHIEGMYRGQGSHKHCRNAGVHPHWEVQLLHASKMVYWVVMTPDWPLAAGLKSFLELSLLRQLAPVL